MSDKKKKKKVGIDIENPFFEWMNRLGDMIILNIIFLISCLPIITIGTALTTSYRLLFRIRRGEYVQLFVDYKKVFAEEWKKTSKAWLLMLFVGALLFFDFYVVGRMEGSIGQVLGIGIGVLLFLWEMCFCYLFPLMASFENSIKGHIKTALLMAFRHITKTIPLMVMQLILPMTILLDFSVFGMLVPIYLLFGFSMIGYIQTGVYEIVFAVYRPSEVDDL